MESALSTIGKVGIGIGALAVVALVAGWWGWYRPTRDAVDIGAAMLAKQMCSCVFVAGREAKDCRADQFESMDPIQLEVLREEERVRAWVPLLGERTAVHREGLGCTLEPSRG